MWTTACGDGRPSITFGATTSTYDSGLLEHLMERFGDAHPDIAVRTIVVGSGEALELGRRGDLDLLLVHAPAAEARFVAEGHARERTPLMSNEFVLAGPRADPANVRGATPAVALAAIAGAGATFVSRGDSSGTHERELALWDQAGIDPAGDWYVETGQGQATTLQIADQRGGYALTDRATFDVLAGILELAPLVAEHPELVNDYSLILPTRGRHPDAAATLAGWLASGAGRDAIVGFRLPGAARPLFTPAPGVGSTR